MTEKNIQDEASKLANKFSELLIQWNEQTRITTFNREEQAIWLIVSIHHEIEMDGFASVVDQLLTRNELLDAINFLKELDEVNLAHLLEQSLTLLDVNHFYTSDGQPQIVSYSLPENVITSLDEIGTQIYRDEGWNRMDQKLTDLLR